MAATCLFALSIVGQGVQTRALARDLGETLSENEKIRSDLREAIAEKAWLTSPEKVRQAAVRSEMIQGVSAPR